MLNTLMPFVQMVEYSTNFTGLIEQTEQHYQFDHKNGNQFSMTYDYAQGMPVIVNHNTNEELYTESLKEFINFTQLPF